MQYIVTMTGMIKRIRKNNNLLIVYHNVKDHTVDGGVRAWSIVAVSFCLSIIEVGGALFLVIKKIKLDFLGWYWILFWSVPSIPIRLFWDQ